MKRYWAKLKKIDINTTSTVWYVNEPDFKRGIKNHGNWEITDMGVDDISGCDCDCCEHFSIWEAGGCNIENGEPICTHKDVKSGSGYPRAIAYHEDVTPDWCPIYERTRCIEDISPTTEEYVIISMIDNIFHAFLKIADRDEAKAFAHKLHEAKMIVVDRQFFRGLKKS